MKILIKTAFITLLAVSTLLYAGSGHSYEKKIITIDSIKEIAQKKVQSLVKQKKVAKSWNNIPVAKVEQNKTNYKKDWVVSFKNAKIAKQSKQTLYIFVSKSGLIKGANYTGK